MSEETKSDQFFKDPKNPTPEEVKAYKEKMMAFYNEELPLLRLKAEYEKLNSELAQDRMKELMANAKIVEYNTAHAAFLKEQEDSKKK